MSINLIKRNWSGTPQHPNLFGVRFSKNFGGQQAKDTIFWLKSTNVPSRDINHGTIAWMNGEFHYVTRTTPANTWTAEFYLFEDMGAMQFLQGWYDKTVNVHTGEFGQLHDYKADAAVFLMDSTGSTETLTFVMRDMMLTSVGSIDNLDYGEDREPPTVMGTFRYETFDILFSEDKGLRDGQVTITF